MIWQVVSRRGPLNIGKEMQASDVLHSGQMQKVAVLQNDRSGIALVVSLVKVVDHVRLGNFLTGDRLR